MDKKLGALSIPDFCTRYAIGRSFAYQEIGAGRLMARKAGSRTIIPIQAAEEWLASLQEANSEVAPSAVA
mgnify:CR=1 FL=1